MGGSSSIRLVGSGRWILVLTLAFVETYLIWYIWRFGLLSHWWFWFFCVIIFNACNSSRAGAEFDFMLYNVHKKNTVVAMQ